MRAAAERAFKILAVLVSFFLLFSPPDLSDSRLLFAFMSFSEFKITIFSILVFSLFFSSAVSVFQFSISNIQMASRAISLAISRRKFTSAAFFSFTVILFCFSFAFLLLAFSRIYYIEARSAKHLLRNDFTIIRQRVIADVNRDLEEGRTSLAIVRLSNIAKMFPDDWRASWSDTLQRTLRYKVRLSNDLLVRGQKYHSENRLKSAAKTLRSSFLVNPENGVAKHAYQQIIEHVHSDSFKSLVRQASENCLRHTEPSRFKDTLEGLRPIYVDNVKVDLERLSDLVCRDGISQVAKIEHDDPYETTKERFTFIPIVRGLNNYRPDEIDDYMEDLTNALSK